MFKFLVLPLIFIIFFSRSVFAEEKVYQSVSELFETDEPLINYLTSYNPIDETGLSQEDLFDRYLGEVTFCLAVTSLARSLAEDAYKNANDEDAESLKVSFDMVNKMYGRSLRAMIYMGTVFKPEKKLLEQKTAVLSNLILSELFESDQVSEENNQPMSSKYGEKELKVVSLKCSAHLSVYMNDWQNNSEEGKRLGRAIKSMEGKQLRMENGKPVLVDKEKP